MELFNKFYNLVGCITKSQLKIVIVALKMYPSISC